MFCQTHPATAELKRIMEDKKAEGKNPCRSLIGVLAMDMAKAGGDGMRELTRRFSHSGVAMNFDSDSFKGMDPETRRALIRHHATIIFGVSVVGIEDILCEGVFDIRQWCDHYNMTMSGTPFPGLGTEGEDVERLTIEQQRALYPYADRDKTLVIFFNEGMGSLPARLQSILNNPSGRLQQIRNIIPIYKERARFLVGQ